MIQPQKRANKGGWRFWLALGLLVLTGSLMWWLQRADDVVPLPIFVEAPTEDPGTLGLISGLRLDPTGSLSVLVVFAQFADERSLGDDVPGYADQLFQADRPGSFTHFYDTMSSGQLRIVGTVLPRRYTSPKPASAYLASRANAWGGYSDFARDILALVDADTDLTRFDNDGDDGVPNSGDDDRTVDYVFLIMRSVPRNFIIGGADGKAGIFPGYFVSADVNGKGRAIVVQGKRYTSSIMAEGSFDKTVGVMAHEFGHGLGLPDLYDPDYIDDPGIAPARDSAGIGLWGLMGHGAHGWTGRDGPSPMMAWSREQLGWLGPNNERLVVTDPSQVPFEISDADLGGTVHKVWLDHDPEYAEEEREYLLLEYRDRNSHDYNRQLPADGVLVWHVRPRFVDNSDELFKLVDLVCADGRWLDAGFPMGRRRDLRSGGDNLDFWAHDAAYAATHRGNMGDASDMFRRGTVEPFTLYPEDENTEPVMLQIGGPMPSVRGTADGMVAVVSLPSQTATAVREAVAAVSSEHQPLSNFPNPFNPETTIRFSLAEPAAVRLSVYNSLGQRVRILLDDEQPAGPHELAWDSRDASGQPVASGTYLCRLEIEGGQPQTLAMTVLR